MDYFNSSLVKALPISLQQNSFKWPNIELEQKTVLLKLKVKTSKFSPFLEITSNNHKITQYIEPKSCGIKYFNVTDMINKVQAHEKIILSGKQLKLNGNSAELLIFQHNITSNSKILVIAPHPDDAEIAAFGLYSTHDSYIITITVGDGGNLNYCEVYAQDPIEQTLMKAKLRTLDSITVPMLGGINPQKSINLGYFNNKLSAMHNNPTQPQTSTSGISDTRLFRSFNLSKLAPHCSGEATWNNLINDLTILINHIKPDIIATPHPLLDKHPDHRFSSLAVFAAAANCRLNEGQFFFYVIHPTYSYKYPYGPKHTPVTLPPNFNEFTIPCGVYSEQLTIQKQRQKIFAMDAMTDLREAPDHICSVRKALRQKFKKLRKKYRHINSWHNYFRRAIRSNEIFLTLPYNKVNELYK